jgi:hypothetical protein
MKSGSRGGGLAAVVGFESSQWQSTISLRRLLGQACMGLWLSRGHRSVAAVTTWWIDCRQLLEVEFDDGLQLVGQRRAFEIWRQIIQPSTVFPLQRTRWRLRRPSVSAVEQGAGLVLRVRRDVVGAA